MQLIKLQKFHIIIIEFNTCFNIVLGMRSNNCVYGGICFLYIQ